jgi:hypothetical protein
MVILMEWAWEKSQGGKGEKGKRSKGFSSSPFNPFPFSPFFLVVPSEHILCIEIHPSFQPPVPLTCPTLMIKKFGEYQ